MRFDYHQLNYEHFVDLLKSKGMTTAQFNKMYRTAFNTNATFTDRVKQGWDIRVSTLIRICEMMDTSLDSLFVKDCANGTSVNGNNNVINSSLNYRSSNPEELRAENRALRMLITELSNSKTRLENELNRMFDLVTKLGGKKE